MKLVFLLSVFLLRIVSGDEVRSYDVELILLQQARAMSRNPDPFADRSDLEETDRLPGAEWLGSVVKEAGFESRFLKEAGELRECWQRVEEVIGYDDFDGKAVYDVKNGKLIVSGGLGVHRALRRSIENEMPIQLRMTHSVYELPGVSLDDRSGFWDEVPKEAKLLRELSWLSLPGQMSEAADRSIWAVNTLQIDAYDSFVEAQSTFGVDLPGRGFSWKTGFYGVIGMNWAQEVGSLDGKTTLMMVSRIDQIRPNGELWDEWVLDENGTFMHDDRLEVIRPWSPSDLPNEEEGGLRRFTVSPSFERFLTIDPEGEDDPFAAGDDPRPKAVPIRRLLEQNGITFREGDSADFLRSSSTLIVRLSKENVELLDGILNAAIGTGPPEIWSVELAEVEGEDFSKGTILRKTGVFFCPGAVTEVTFGDDLAFFVDMNLDTGQELMEMRLVLAEEGGDLEKPSLKTGVEIRVGHPTVLRTTVVDGKQRSWVATARVKILENEVGEFLKKREGGK